MPGDAARALDPRFPNLRPEVVQGYLEAPDTMVAEIVDGELSLMPRPRPRHAHAAGELHGELRGPFQRAPEGPGGWVFLDEPELHLGPTPDIVVPDLAGWRRERFPADAFDEETTALTVAPDWVCELLSPRTRTHDRGGKQRVYRREGVRHLWYVDPAARSVEVCRLEAAGYVVVDTFQDDARMRAPPFATVDIPLSVLWRW